MRPLLAALLLAALPAALPVSAAEPQQLTGISAEVVDEGQVRLDVTYEGGACDRTGEGDVTAADNYTVLVTIPTTRVGEVCTMRAVPVHFSQVIAIQPGTRTITATVLTTDGQPFATGTVELDAVVPDKGSPDAGAPQSAD
jgi:hypothetical protein